MDVGTLEVKEGPDSDEQPKLDQECQEVGDRVGDRHNETREVNFAEQTGIGIEGAGATGQTTREVSPGHHPSHVKEKRWCTVRGKFGDATEYNGENRGGNDGLDEKPERAKDGLLVSRGEVALDQKIGQIAVAPDFLPIDVKKAVLGLDDLGPSGVGGGAGDE